MHKIQQTAQVLFCEVKAISRQTFSVLNGLRDYIRDEEKKKS